MDYAKASAIGDLGEQRVGDLLRSEAPALGYRVLNNVLLVDDHTTAQLDHVLVDRFGMLVVETKNYRALIRGKSDDRSWTACYSGGRRRREKFQNPLRQNDRHREMLHRVLGACGRNCRPATYRAWSSLREATSTTFALTTVTRCASFLNRRWLTTSGHAAATFRQNPGALDAEQVTDLVSLLRSVNKCDDPDVADLHAENVHCATRRFSDRFRGRGRGRIPAAPVNPYGAAIVYDQNARYPDGSQHVPARRVSGSLRLAGNALGAALVLAMAWWLVVGGGQATLGALGDAVVSAVSVRGTTTPAPDAAPARAASSVGYDTKLALRRLREVDARTYARLVDPSTPRLSTTRGLPTYTWEYLEKPSKRSVVVREISITLDASGRIVGVTSR